LLPEHIVIAMLKEGAGIACKSLLFLRIDLAEFRHTLELEIPRLPGALLLGDAPPSKRTRLLLENAAEEARFLASQYIGTEHLLFAAVKERSAPVCAYLIRRAVDMDMLRVVAQTNFSHDGETKNEGDFLPAGGYERSFERTYDSSLFHNDERSRSRVKNSPYSGLTPTLDEHSHDMTALARAGKLDPVVGRRKEIDRTVRILARRMKNNPILVGESGVGKTAIVEGLAQIVASGGLPDALARKRVICLDIASVVAGTKYRGEFEERVKRIMKEIAQAGNVILFI
jgi:ATP-dependent Clp protease ATP-binding subunit ClpC